MYAYNVYRYIAHYVTVTLRRKELRCTFFARGISFYGQIIQLFHQPFVIILYAYCLLSCSLIIIRV